jgi:hypothetical protein
VYALHEHEIQTISMMNTQATVFFSAGSGFVSFGLGIIVNALFQTNLTPSGEVLFKIGAPLVVLCSMLFFGLGFWAIHKRNNTFAQIKRESVVAP